MLNKRTWYKVTGSLLTAILLITGHLSRAQAPGQYQAVYSGVPWLDNNGNRVSAHGGCIIKDKGKYYFFGERHTDTSDAFAGFDCYSSADLYNWKFESVALPVRDKGKLGPNRIGERPKVMKCPQTGAYIMFMHVDTLGYTDQFIGYATAKNITGPYTFRGPVLFKGKPVRKWDMGTFQDKDGSGYLLIHGGGIFKLSKDYKSIIEQTNPYFTSGFESPVLFRKDRIYYFLGSHLTSWERNDNYYFTATSLKGPWTARGTFAPHGKLTWNSQSTFVLPVEGAQDTAFIFMGDRWSYPRQASAATYVWQPFKIDGATISIPDYKYAWKIDVATGKVTSERLSGRIIKSDDLKDITYSGQWHREIFDTLSVYSSDIKDARLSVNFTGSQIALFGLSRSDGGYAYVTISKDNKVILSEMIDMYCKYPVSELKFISPVLAKGKYTLRLTVCGVHGNWSDKEHRKFGSKGNMVSLDKIIIQ